MAKIAFLLRERSEDGEIDQPLFVCEDFGRARALTLEYLEEALSEELEFGDTEKRDQYNAARQQLEKTRPTPSCREVIDLLALDRVYTLEAVLVLG